MINIKVDRLTSFKGNPSIVGLMFILELTASSFIERNYKTQFVWNTELDWKLKRKHHRVKILKSDRKMKKSTST